MLYKIVYENELYHHGVKGMRWGVRRYQNEDGSLTPKGRAKMLERARKYESKAKTSVANNYFAKSRKARLEQKAKSLRSEVRRKDLEKTRKEKEETNRRISLDEHKNRKNVKNMTSEEIEAAIKRKQLEEQYEKYYPNHAKNITKKMMGEVAGPVMISVGRNLGQKLLNKYGEKLIDDAFAVKKDPKMEKMEKELAKARVEAELYRNLKDIKEYKKKMNGERTMAEENDELKNQFNNILYKNKIYDEMKKASDRHKTEENDIRDEKEVFDAEYKEHRDDDEYWPVLRRR